MAAVLNSRIKFQGIVTFGLIALLFTFCLPAATAYSYVPPYAKTENLPRPEEWGSSEEIDDEDDYVQFIRKIIAGIVVFVIVIVAICLVLCFCCPICIIAKMRQRRGAVIRSGNGATAVQNGNTITVTMNRTAPLASSHMTSPPVVAIPNNYNAGSKPYPVQESVTVVPLLQPQQPVQYPPQPMNIGYPPTSGPQFHPQSFELPPPYPGLPRDPNPDTSNLPYNPYFTGDNEGPNAPPK